MRFFASTTTFVYRKRRKRAIVVEAAQTFAASVSTRFHGRL
jgi:hypothetical protein